ncbi:MAG TPA: orotidine-5'-phosphate decarboxylase [Aestuariivirga sp.]|nr:orotidine-5'-phosphate decarboxylase [Aestuariivirga sp.]
MTKPLPSRNPVCVALDTPDVARARALARALRPHVGFMKLGMEFFYAAGTAGYEAVAAEGLPLFLDLKLHDIPHTVAQGLSSLMRLSPAPAILNVHAQGGLEMMRQARAAVGGKTKLIAVTILTSLSTDDIHQTGLDAARDTAAHAQSLALLAQRAGLDGVVCSPHDLMGIRAACGRDFLTVVPGIRPEQAEAHDQKRIATPQAALAAGADILVIGRAITGATDPAAAAARIQADLA